MQFSAPHVLWKDSKIKYSQNTYLIIILTLVLWFTDLRNRPTLHWLALRVLVTSRISGWREGKCKKTMLTNVMSFISTKLVSCVVFLREIYLSNDRSGKSNGTQPLEMYGTVSNWCNLKILYVCCNIKSTERHHFYFKFQAMF